MMGSNKSSTYFLFGASFSGSVEGYDLVVSQVPHASERISIDFFGDPTVPTNESSLPHKSQTGTSSNHNDHRSVDTVRYDVVSRYCRKRYPPKLKVTSNDGFLYCLLPSLKLT